MAPFVAAIGLAAAAAVGVALTTTTAFVVGAVLLGVATYTAVRTSRLRDGASVGSSAGFQTVVRGTTEPRRIVYGQAMLSGPIVYMNSAGTENRDLYIVIALTGHEIDSFVGVYLDDKFVPIADVHTLGGGGTGDVFQDTGSPAHGYGPIGSTTVLYIREHLGATGQTVDTMLDTAFADITTNHRMRGCSYLVLRLVLVSGGEQVWQNGVPSNIAVVLKGKKVYDPRLDSTFVGTWGTGSGAQRVATPSTWAYSTNPPLCQADYLIDSDLGAGYTSARVDYDSVALAADACDTLVAIPVATTEKRFTCNGVLEVTDDHGPNIEAILSSMGGRLRYYNGQWRIRASTFPSTDFTLTQADLIGPVTFRNAPERTERYNAVRGTYFDPSRQYKSSQYLTVNDTTTRTNRDASLVLYKDLDLPMTNSEYMAQRLAFRALNQCTLTGLCVFPLGYQGMNIAPHDTGTVTLSELGWSSKIMRAVALRHVDMVGVEPTLKEDSSAAYTDPIEAAYGTRTAAGAITFPTAPPLITGVIFDPLFKQPIGNSWIIEAGAGVSIVSGGGEGGGNALQLTNGASTTQAARNDNRFNTSVGEVISCEFRVTKTTNVASIVARFSYYRSDTMASLGTVDQTLTLAATGTYYTISLRQRTPTTYTLAAGVLILCDVQVRMVPSGAGTATATFSSISGTRSGTVGTPEIAIDAATALYSATLAGPTTTGTQVGSFLTLAVPAQDTDHTAQATLTFDAWQSTAVPAVKTVRIRQMVHGGAGGTNSEAGYVISLATPGDRLTIQMRWAATAAVAYDYIVDFDTGDPTNTVTVQTMRLQVEVIKR